MRMDSSGVRNNLSPLIGEENFTPSSDILRNSPNEKTWKPPESVVLGRANQVTVWVRDQAFDTSSYVKDRVARFQVK